jgi:hypothetical protein
MVTASLPLTKGTTMNGNTALLGRVLWNVSLISMALASIYGMFWVLLG